MFIYVSKPQSPAVNFFKGPFLLGNKILGDGSTAPTSPFAFTPSPAIVTPNNYFFRVNVSNADGRLSSSYILKVTT